LEFVLLQSGRSISYAVKILSNGGGDECYQSLSLKFHYVSTKKN